jgi:hypothetical protein
MFLRFSFLLSKEAKPCRAPACIAGGAAEAAPSDALPPAHRWRLVSKWLQSPFRGGSRSLGRTHDVGSVHLSDSIGLGRVPAPFAAAHPSRRDRPAASSSQDKNEITRARDAPPRARNTRRAVRSPPRRRR